jgi:hypothetical protein
VLAGINYGYINGYPDGTFKPENTITRAEFVKIVNSAKGYTAMKNIPFRDVPVNEWYFQEVQKAYQAEYIAGDNEGNFNPNAQITRQEVAVILNRIEKGGDTSYALNGVNDANKIDEWALPAVRAVYSRGYITGNDAGNFSPLSPLKRGEAVTIMNRVLGVPPLQPGESLVALSISNINITDVKTNGATLNITSTRDGNAYWVILEGENATTPTAEQIRVGRTSSNGSPAGSGSRAVYANSPMIASSTSLQAEQSYKVCAVVYDAAANISAVAIRTFTTSGEGDTGEEWLNNNFNVDNVTNNSVRLTVNSTRQGRLYYVVVEDPNRNVKTPSQSNIRNSKDANGTSANSNTIFAGYLDVYANSSNSKDISGLKGGTNYKVFGCVYDSTSNSNLYSTVKSRTFTTTGSNVNWITTYEIPQNSITATGAQLNVVTASGRTGTFYYVVTETSTYPTDYQIRSNQDAIGGHSINSIASSGSSSNYSIPINNTSLYPITLYNQNLVSGRTYYVFGVLYTNTNEYSEVERTSFTAGSGYATLTYVEYGLSTTTTRAAITFNGSGTSYTAPTPVIATGGADVTIYVTKLSGASTITPSAKVDGAGVATLATSFRIPYSGLTDAQTPITLTVAENGRTQVTYTIYINR